MNRSTWKFLGAVALFPFAFMGLFPWLVDNTELFVNTSPFDWTINGITVLSLQYTVSGEQIATAWVGVWGIAVFGEIILLGLNLFRPPKVNNNVISGR